MIPAAAVHDRVAGLDVQGDLVVVALISRSGAVERDDAEPGREGRVVLGGAFGLDLVEGAFEIAGRAAVGAPVAVPEGARIVLVGGGDDEPHAGIGVVVPGDGAAGQLGAAGIVGLV